MDTIIFHTINQSPEWTTLSETVGVQFQNQSHRWTRQAVLMSALSKYLPEKEIKLYLVTKTLKSQYMFKYLS